MIATGMYYEDFKIGEKFITKGRTITEADLVNWVNLTWTTALSFADQEYSEKSSIFKKRFIPGLMTLAYSIGLEIQLGYREDTGLACLGTDELRVVAPVVVGDTIHVEIEVVQKRETKHPDRGIITFKRTIKNQGGATVMHMYWTTLFRRRPKPS